MGAIEAPLAPLGLTLNFASLAETKMTFSPSACPCTRPMDHANKSATATPIINSDRCMSFSSVFFVVVLDSNLKADAFYTGKPRFLRKNDLPLGPFCRIGDRRVRALFPILVFGRRAQ